MQVAAAQTRQGDEPSLEMMLEKVYPINQKYTTNHLI